MHHLSWQSEQGWIMDPSQCSSQNRQSGPLGCSLGGVVTVVGDAMLKMIVVVEMMIACKRKFDEDQVTENRGMTTTTSLRMHMSCPSLPHGNGIHSLRAVTAVPDGKQVQI
jgi:hypothetical protein